jgi:hypothetical protein
MQPVNFTVRANYNWSNGAEQYRDFPVRISIPQPPGACAADTMPQLTDDAGQVIAAHFKPLCRWPDGSIRVFSLWFPATLDRSQTRSYTAAAASPGQAAPVATTVPAAINTFKLTVVLPDARLEQTIEFTDDGIDAGAHTYEQERGFQLKDYTGAVIFHGALIRRHCNWYPGFELSVRIIQASSQDTLPVHGIRLEFDLPGRGPVRYAIRQSAIMVDHPRLVDSQEPFEVVADAAGVHVTAAAQLGENEEDYPPYERGAYLCQVDNWVGMADDEAGWLLIVPEAHERFPKAWRIEDHHVTIDLHPHDAEPLAWRQGMALFQRLHIGRLNAATMAAQFENEAWCYLRPPIVSVDPEVYRQAGWRIPFRYEPERFPKTEMLIARRFEFTLPHGTFDWGDDLSPRGVGRNLEYDFPAVAAKEYARTGNPWLLKLLRSAAEHMMYTDFVAVSSDPWKEGGITAHCLHHTTGSAYPSHMWAEGLTLYYLLSGDRYALQVACRVGDFFLKYIRSRFQTLQATAREFGWTLIALAGVYDVTRQEEYLDGIRTLVDYYLDRPLEEFYPLDAVFTIAVAIIGLDRTRHFHRDEDTRRFILAVLDKVMATRRDGAGNYEYWYDAELGAIPYIQSYIPEALNIGYQLSGDEKYLRSALRQYQMAQAGIPLTVENQFGRPECGYAAGYHITWTGCFASFAELGWLDKMQYPDVTG